MEQELVYKAMPACRQEADTIISADRWEVDNWHPWQEPGDIDEGTQNKDLQYHTLAQPLQTSLV
jgi:hypothetical protein